MAEPSGQENQEVDVDAGAADAVNRHDEPDTAPSERSPQNMTEPMDSDTLPTPTPTPTPNPTTPNPTTGRRAPDVLTLVVGLMSVGAAILVLAGWVPQLRWFDLRWILSGGAVVLGVLLLAASARSPRKPPRHPTGSEPAHSPSAGMPNGQ